MFRLILCGLLFLSCNGERIKKNNSSLSWTLQDSGLWKNNIGGLAYKDQECRENGDCSVLYLTRIGHDGPALRDVIDEVTFRHLFGNYYRDKNRIYHHYEMAGGGFLNTMESIGNKTFQSVAGCYVKDKNGARIEGASL